MNNLRVYLSSGALIASTCVMLAIAKRGSHKPCRSHTKGRWKVGQTNQASGIVIPGLATEKPDARSRFLGNRADDRIGLRIREWSPEFEALCQLNDFAWFHQRRLGFQRN
jgi:hypothetical protein